MAASKTTNPQTAAGKKLSREERAHASAMQLIGQAVDLLASGGNTLTPDGICSAGIPNIKTSGKSMIDAQKFRINWYSVERQRLNQIARLMVERNWFVRPVHEINKALYGAGFTFAAKDARDWVEKSPYPVRRIHGDMLHEYLVSSAVCAFWRKDQDGTSLPMIEVPDMEKVHYETIGGIPQITVTVPSNRKIKESLKPVIGEKMWECIRNGKKLVISKTEEDDSGYDFEILKDGKTTGCIPAPAVTGILDDLDYIEAIRCGDWNGAWSRREILRHTKKGSGVSSGPNAGTARNNAKTADIKAILAAMSKILGKADVATNWDQEIDWLTFPKDFFDPSMVEASLRRLVFYGGFSALLLLKTDSQIAGMESYALDLTRARISAFRSEFGSFVSKVFGAIAKMDGGPDLLVPKWSVKSLYSTEGVSKLVTLFATYGIASTPTLREMMDIDNDAEGDAMERCHENPKRFTPVFEPRQGIASSMIVPESAPSSNSGVDQTLPGSPGRPPVSA